LCIGAPLSRVDLDVHVPSGRVGLAGAHSHGAVFLCRLFL
jgi:hypothetical protein